MKKALVVIDMQNDFINGALGTSEAQAIVGNVKKKIEQALKAGDDVIFTQDTHYDTYLWIIKDYVKVVGNKFDNPELIEEGV